MPLTRAQAAQEETNGNAEEQQHKEPELEQVRSPFETELLTTVQEQRDLLKEYKDQQDGRVFEVVNILNDAIQNLSNEFARVCDKNRQLETVVFQLRDRVESLESEVKSSQEILEKTNAGVFASLHRMIKSELREEFESVLSARVKTEETANKGLTNVLSGAGRSQLGKEKQPAECNVTTARGTDYSAGRLVQKPAVFDGRSSWEAYATQFEIVAEINQWDGPDKAAFLATSLRGPALTVLSNLPSESRVHYPSLLAALESRFGNKRQSELHRMKLRNRVRRRDETLPELAEDIERLARLAYPEAPTEVLETLTKDQFIDALNDDEMRLRVAQARPTTLRAALGIALEIESFSLAARRRFRPVRTVHETPTKTNAECFVDPQEETLKRNSEFLTELKKMMSELREVVRSVNRRGRNQDGSPPKGKRKCWTCGSEDHLQQDCRLYNAEKKRTESENEQESGQRGGARR
ncbi:Retrovirus-related Pol poly from transposon 412 [Paramuricea clavata]|uniref:Retrovirus-related Pol poly from transposon 412 n=1 Tax=Paramuricea clavata TaxID=317549 RepID=A0A6S7K5D5_PARCT|nr:Retrovirus-related Pol poly from transposon 412 [Paramuricea clavata]